MFEKMLAEYKASLEEMEEFQRLGKFKNQAQEQKTEAMIAKLKDVIESTEAILANLNDYHYDATTGDIMHFANDNKHFKRISNAFDIRSSRYDEGVYYDYLSSMMTAVQRNMLNISLVETLNRIKNDRFFNNNIFYYYVWVNWHWCIFCNHMDFKNI